MALDMVEAAELVVHLWSSFKNVIIKHYLGHVCLILSMTIPIVMDYLRRA